MDIQKVFLKQAQLYLNSSLVVLIPGLILILVNILVFSRDILMVFVLPFFVYSLFLFQKYLLNYKRSMHTAKKIEKTENEDFLSTHQLLLYFDKEENELLFLHPNGVLIAKIVEDRTKDKYFFDSQLAPKQFTLLDSKENRLASYYWKYDTIDHYQKEAGYIGSLTYGKEGVFNKLTGEAVALSKNEAFLFDDYIRNEQGHVVLRVRKGWMSLKLQELFQNPNIPILTISHNLTEQEKLFYLSLLIKRFFK